MLGIIGVSLFIHKGEKGCLPAVGYWDNPHQPSPVSRLAHISICAHSGPPLVYSGHEEGGYMKGHGCPQAGDPERDLGARPALSKHLKDLCALAEGSKEGAFW